MAPLTLPSYPCLFLQCQARLITETLQILTSFRSQVWLWPCVIFAGHHSSKRRLGNVCCPKHGVRRHFLSVKLIPVARFWFLGAWLSKQILLGNPADLKPFTITKYNSHMRPLNLKQDLQPWVLIALINKEKLLSHTYLTFGELMRNIFLAVY